MHALNFASSSSAMILRGVSLLFWLGSMSISLEKSSMQAAAPDPKLPEASVISRMLKGYEISRRQGRPRAVVVGAGVIGLSQVLAQPQALHKSTRLHNEHQYVAQAHGAARPHGAAKSQHH